MNAPTRDLSPGRRLVRAIRSTAAAAAALALPVAVFAVSLGAGPASAAVRPAITAGGVTWHKLALINGWQSSDGTHHTGDPAWAIRKGVVYLSGSLHQPTVVNSLFAVLPPAARPAHAIYIEVYTFAGGFGHIDIFPNGEVGVATLPPQYAQEYSSLAGISYPIAGASTHKLTLLHGWKPSIALDGKPTYAVSGGVVYLSGALQAHRQQRRGCRAPQGRQAGPRHVHRHQRLRVQHRRAAGRAGRTSTRLRRPRPHFRVAGRGLVAGGQGQDAQAGLDPRLEVRTEALPHR